MYFNLKPQESYTLTSCYNLLESPLLSSATYLRLIFASSNNFVGVKGALESKNLSTMFF